jgi:hypothetical protein
VPPDASGPGYELGLQPDPNAAPRPAQWSVAPVVVVPTGVTITEVDLWWDMPDYVALAVSD